MGKLESANMNNQEASKMLEAALQEMDGLINCVRLENGEVSPPVRTVSEIAEELSAVISESTFLPNLPNQRVALVLQNWINQNVKNGPELEERIIKLENDKESLQLQVTVLTDQVEAQSEKISDLQNCLEGKRQQLNTTEDVLQREILSKSSLETQKLELMSTISELKLQNAALERENIELREEKRRLLAAVNQSVKPPTIPRNSSPGNVYTNRLSPSNYNNNRSNPFQTDTYQGNNPFTGPGDAVSSTPNNSSQYNNGVLNLSPSPIIAPGVSSGHKRDYIVELNGGRRTMDQFNSLPRQREMILTERQLQDGGGGGNNSNNVVLRKNVVFGKPFNRLITLSSEKSYSAPNLAETEKVINDDVTSQRSEDERDSTNITDSTQNLPKKGIRKIFNKIKRSSSGNINDLLGSSEFRRGGVRSTAGPRLGGPAFVRISILPDKPFEEWTPDDICNWLEDLGLENYVADARRWVKSGSHMLSVTQHEMEKELGVKNPLHRKKLTLALLQCGTKNCGDELLQPAGHLDTAWVLRWLDDVGLPQHKESFLTARVDGRVLHRLTMDDLTTLHVTSVLHVASLRRGIQMLRENRMDGNCLTRRSLPDENNLTASDVALWTNHRVMEWLRLVDLAEYAPNLRGSGVHGALMVYENKFTAELLASLLNIPASKSLLRRHLNTHFKELLGREIIQVKRETETTLGYVPLTPAAKVKIVKKSQFTLKKKKEKTDEFGDLVCPLQPGPHATSGDELLTYNTNTQCTMKEKRLVPDVCPLTETSSGSPLSERISRV